MSIRSTKQVGLSYLPLESMLDEGGVQVNEAQERTERRKHAFTDIWHKEEA